MDSRFSTYIWQNKDWPDFHWNSEALLEQMSNLSRLHGLLNGRMSVLGIKEKSQSRLTVMTEE